MSDNLHKEHRKRVRKAFLEHGFTDDTPSHKLLEMLLFYSIPQSDTNETAHRLLNEFESVAGVFEADINDLLKIQGIGENSAVLIKLMLPLLKRYQIDKSVLKFNFKNSDEVCKYVINKYFGFTNEVFMILSLNNDGRLIACDKLGEGDMSSVGVSVRDVVKIVLKRNAACVVLSHNHIGGYAFPSKCDVEMTKLLKSTLAQMGIRLIDHIIVANDDAVSMLQTPKYREIFK